MASQSGKVRKKCTLEIHKKRLEMIQFSEVSSGATWCITKCLFKQSWAVQLSIWVELGQWRFGKTINKNWQIEFFKKFTLLIYWFWFSFDLSPFYLYFLEHFELLGLSIGLENEFVLCNKVFFLSFDLNDDFNLNKTWNSFFLIFRVSTEIT